MYTNNQVQVTMIKTDETISSIQVQELSGKLLWQKSYDTSLRSQKITTANFADGMYVIQLVSGKGISSSQKLIINH